jgi:uncharacterized protein (DUF488 family)
MSPLLCTIGFAGKTAEEFFALLKDAGVRQVIDIRQHRGGQLSGFAKHPDLAYFLNVIASITYRHEPLLAPTPELLKTYRKTKDWPAYEHDFLSLMKERRIPEIIDPVIWSSPMALLCSEPGPEKCHRRLVADLLAEYWRGKGQDVEIRHLVTQRARPASAKRKNTRAVS